MVVVCAVFVEPVAVVAVCAVAKRPFAAAMVALVLAQVAAARIFAALLVVSCVLSRCQLVAYALLVWHAWRRGLENRYTAVVAQTSQTYASRAARAAPIDSRHCETVFHALL